MDPTANYYKTKRSLLLFAGALFLAVFAGFKIANRDQHITFLPFQLERPDLLGAILLVAVAFYLFQFSLQWAAQTSDTQKNRFHRIDFVATATVGSLSGLCYLGSLALPRLVEAISIFSTSDRIAFVSGFISSALGVLIASVTLSKGLLTIAASFGRWIRGREASEDQKLVETLTSKDWMIHYNPQNQSARKRIRFSEDGTIPIGSNSNESSWRVRNELLEILNSDGKVFSRFIYEPSSQKFIHTNDDDTLSIRSQYIFRAPGHK